MQMVGLRHFMTIFPQKKRGHFPNRVGNIRDFSEFLYVNADGVPCKLLPRFKLLRFYHSGHGPPVCSTIHSFCILNSIAVSKLNTCQ
jgi:hypothetical protein